MKAPKNTNAQYYCFNEKGKCELPSIKLIKELISNNLEPVIFLDSNVCLNIIDIVDNGKKSKNKNKHKVLNLKEYINKSKININGLFGFMELCQKNGILDTKKMSDFKLRLDFYKQIPLKHFKRFNYDFHKDFFIHTTPNFKENNNWYGLDRKILFSYCSLLKIREISIKKGLSKRNALSNLNEFSYWMKNDLGLIFGLEYKLAMGVFGGITEYRKMIWLEGKKELTYKKLIGTVWDFIHARFCLNNMKISQILEQPISAFFLTNDRNLFQLISKFKLSGYIETGDNKPTVVYNTDFNYPHFNEELIESHNNQSLDNIYESINSEFKFDKQKIINQIQELELINGINHNN